MPTRVYIEIVSRHTCRTYTCPRLMEEAAYSRIMGRIVMRKKKQGAVGRGVYLVARYPLSEYINPTFLLHGCT